MSTQQLASPYSEKLDVRRGEAMGSKGPKRSEISASRQSEPAALPPSARFDRDDGGRPAIPADFTQSAESLIRACREASRTKGKSTTRRDSGESEVCLTQPKFKSGRDELIIVPSMGAAPTSQPYLDISMKSGTEQYHAWLAPTSQTWIIDTDCLASRSALERVI